MPAKATKPRSAPDPLLALAKKHFGFRKFRAAQKEAIATLKRKRDCLVVMPTGSGKSAIYQIGALLFRGMTLVISPLIALQQDQASAIEESNAPNAILLNSALRASEAREAKEKIEQGASKYILLAPEQLRRSETLDMLRQSGVSMIVVDEAHCISEWGHDFRPDYLRLGGIVELLGHPVVLAMTATAAPRVREEIVQRLGMKNPRVFVEGFDRPNIYLRVDTFDTESAKLEELVHRIRWAERPGIVYTATRKNAEGIVKALKDEGIEALLYHAGLKASDRAAAQNEFMESDSAIMVATNAFGMGVDKPNVRFVYHADVPDSLDSYYQEIGRAGRDGKKAEAILFYRLEDIGTQKFLSGEGKIDGEHIEKIVTTVANQNGPVPTEAVAQETGLSPRKLTAVLQKLEDAGALEVHPEGEIEAAPGADPAEIIEAVEENQEQRRRMKQERLRQMQEYAALKTCRREYLLKYFGDEFTPPCGNCDNCPTLNE